MLSTLQVFEFMAESTVVVLNDPADGIPVALKTRKPFLTNPHTVIKAFEQLAQKNNKALLKCQLSYTQKQSTRELPTWR